MAPDELLAGLAHPPDDAKYRYERRDLLCSLSLSLSLFGDIDSCPVVSLQLSLRVLRDHRVGHLGALGSDRLADQPRSTVLHVRPTVAPQPTRR